MASIVSFFQPRPKRAADWSSQELAEFYRVESALVQSGLQVETDRGMSDEGDPWFVFCRGEDGDVIIHLARIDETYVVASAAFDGVLRGRDFRSVVVEMLERHPLVVARNQQRTGPRLLLHPAALLTALVATAFFKLGEAQAHAATADDGGAAGGERASSGRSGFGSWLDQRQVAMIAAAVTLSIAIDEIKSSHTDVLASADEQAQDHGGDHVLAATLAQAQTQARAETADRASLLEAMRAQSSAAVDAAGSEAGAGSGSQPVKLAAAANAPAARAADGAAVVQEATKIDVAAAATDAPLRSAAADDAAQPRDARVAPPPAAGSTTASAEASSQAGQIITHLADATSATLMAKATVVEQAGALRDDVVRFVMDVVTAITGNAGHGNDHKLALGPASDLSHEVTSLVSSLLPGAASAAPGVVSASSVGNTAASLTAAAATDSLVATLAVNASSLVSTPQSAGEATSLTLPPGRDAVTGAVLDGSSPGDVAASLMPTTHPGADGGLQLFDAKASELVKWFFNNNSDVQIVISEHDYILLDGDVMTGDAHDITVRSWSLPDHSTISLIGIIPPAVAAHLLA